MWENLQVFGQFCPFNFLLGRFDQKVGPNFYVKQRPHKSWGRENWQSAFGPWGPVWRARWPVIGSTCETWWPEPSWCGSAGPGTITSLRRSSSSTTRSSSRSSVLETQALDRAARTPPAAPQNRPQTYLDPRDKATLRTMLIWATYNFFFVDTRKTKKRAAGNFVEQK